MPKVVLKDKLNVTVVKLLKDYSEEPVFKKKAEKAKALIKKHGLPEKFRKKAK